jgi:hypothetical protein
MIQGSVAVESFLKYHKESSGFVICLDHTTSLYLKSRNLPKAIVIIDLDELSEIYSIFCNFMKTRSYPEAIISIKPHLIEKYLGQVDEDSYLVYFDADLFFYNSLLYIQEFTSGFEVMLSEHLFPAKMRESIKFGLFNGGLIAFRNSKISRALLERWKNQCTEWCKLELVENRFADQKYLDEFPNNEGVSLLNHPGVNNGQYYFQDKRDFVLLFRQRRIQLEGFPLICFHFHGTRILLSGVSTGFNRYGRPKNFLWVLFGIYLPYIKRIRMQSKYARSDFPSDWNQIISIEKSSHLLHIFLQHLNFTKVKLFWNCTLRSKPYV